MKVVALDKSGQQLEAVDASAKSGAAGSLELVDPASLVPTKPAPATDAPADGDETAPPVEGDEPEAEEPPPAEPEAAEDEENPEDAPPVEKPPEKEIVAINFTTLPESYHTVVIVVSTEANFEHVTHAWFRVIGNDGSEVGRCSIPISVHNMCTAQPHTC